MPSKRIREESQEENNYSSEEEDHSQEEDNLQEEKELEEKLQSEKKKVKTETKSALIEKYSNDKNNVEFWSTKCEMLITAQNLSDLKEKRFSKLKSYMFTGIFKTCIAFGSFYQQPNLFPKNGVTHYSSKPDLINWVDTNFHAISKIIIPHMTVKQEEEEQELKPSTSKLKSPTKEGFTISQLKKYNIITKPLTTDEQTANVELALFKKDKSDKLSFVGKGTFYESIIGSSQD